MRTVIENGNMFSKSHFFMMIKEITVDNIEGNLANYLKILIEELIINQFEFEDFLHEIKTDHLLLYEAYNKIKYNLFNY